MTKTKRCEDCMWWTRFKDGAMACNCLMGNPVYMTCYIRKWWKFWRPK